MPTRFNSNSRPRFGVPGIADKTHQGSPDLYIPPVGIEDTDVALFNLFDKEIVLKVSGDKADPKKVPVIFAAGEKWAMLKKRRALRDQNNSLILPLLTIVRNSVAQDSANDITGRGINQQTGEIVIQRRLDKSDRNYQNLINRYLISNQKNVAVNVDSATPLNEITTERPVGEDSQEPHVIDGAWLADIKKNNIYETIVIPSPQFCTINYEITLWTQYTQHMNQLLEQIMSSFLPQGNSWKLNTPKGYWFIANVDNNSYEPENNVDDMSTEERIIKYKFQVTVKSYVFAGNSPGVNIPIRRYVSIPTIKFDVAPTTSQPGTSEENLVINQFVGSDDPTLPLEERKNFESDQRRKGTRLFSPRDPSVTEDPAVASRSSRAQRSLYRKLKYQDSLGREATKYARVYRVTSASGETVVKLASTIDEKTAPSASDAVLSGISYDIGDVE